MDLNKVFRPKSLAIIGASGKAGSFGHFSATNALKSSIADRVYLINPKFETLLDHRCYKDLHELPEVVDCLLIATANKTVVPILEEGGKMGVGGAVVLASGFSEEHSEEGRELERQLRETAIKYDMAVVGPNCIGIINNLDHIAVWGLRMGDISFNRKKGAAIVGQSGFLTGHMANNLTKVGLSYAASTGNGNVVTLEDCLEFYVDDDNVTVVAAYLEGVKKPEVFIRALKKAALKRKPVVILKGGRSAKGAAGAASHTGSLAGSAKSYEAVFRKFGVVIVDDLVDYIAATQMFTVFNGVLPKTNGIASLNLSGGENNICADICERYGLNHPNFSPLLTQMIKEIIPSFATCANPLDATTSLFGNKEANMRITQAMLLEDAIGTITTGMNLDLLPNPTVDLQVGALCEAVENSPVKKPIFVVPSYEAGRNPIHVQNLASHGIMVTPGGEKAYKLVSLLIRFASYKYEERTLSLSLPARAPTNPIALNEFDSKKMVDDMGIRVPRQQNVISVSELKEVLKELPYPIVLKVNSPDILHKTDAGAVRLNIRNAEDAVRAYDEILANCKKYNKDARIDGILVQEMVPSGQEIIIGVTNDPAFGPMLLVGLGGIFVEIFKDAVLYPVPINKAEALDMLKQLKAYKLLAGYRGSKPLDIDALCDTMVKVSEFASGNKDSLKELDLNPVFVYEDKKGVCAADALIVRE